jgi:N-acetylglutamate synthase-like GNAT family acetyltransferase
MAGARHELKAVTTPDDRQAMHAIRRATLFTTDRPGGPVAYDENHPDDVDPANQCFLLVFDSRPIGVVRLDPRHGNMGVIRLVAIVPELQRQGHGRVLAELVEDKAREFGMTKLALNARQDAVGFYERMGWSQEIWDRAELETFARHCAQMTKSLSTT